MNYYKDLEWLSFSEEEIKRNFLLILDEYFKFENLLTPKYNNHNYSSFSDGEYELIFSHSRKFNEGRSIKIRCVQYHLEKDYKDDWPCLIGIDFYDKNDKTTTYYISWESLTGTDGNRSPDKINYFQDFGLRLEWNNENNHYHNEYGPAIIERSLDGHITEVWYLDGVPLQDAQISALKTKMKLKNKELQNNLNDFGLFDI